MKKVIRVDTNGLYTEDVILNDDVPTPNNCIETPCLNGFYCPKWDGVK